MKTDKDLLMVCEWMEPKPTEKATRHTNIRLKTVSPKGWWCVEHSMVSPPIGDSDSSQMIPDIEYVWNLHIGMMIIMKNIRKNYKMKQRE